MDDSSDDLPSDDYNYRNEDEYDVDAQLSYHADHRARQRQNRKIKRKNLATTLYGTNDGTSMNNREVIDTSKGHGGRPSLLVKNPRARTSGNHSDESFFDFPRNESGYASSEGAARGRRQPLQRPSRSETFEDPDIAR